MARRKASDEHRKRAVTASAITRAKWSVMWIRKGKIYEHKVEYDLNEAIRVYTKLVLAGRSNVTLRSCNVGFPPPMELVEHEVIHWDIVKRKRKGKYKKFKVRRVETVNRMAELNQKGIYWCPYCIKLRRFEQTVWEDRHLMQCPMCDITSRDGHVKRHNPKAIEISYRKRK